MDNPQTREYAVHLSHFSVNGIDRWKAVVESFPQIIAEGPTCEAVLEEIGEKLQSSLSDAENTAAPVSELAPGGGVSASELAELETRLKALGHRCYGIFADDPGALAVFDEIERLRDGHTIGDR